MALEYAERQNFGEFEKTGIIEKQERAERLPALFPYKNKRNHFLLLTVFCREKHGIIMYCYHRPEMTRTRRVRLSLGSRIGCPAGLRGHPKPHHIK